MGRTGPLRLIDVTDNSCWGSLRVIRDGALEAHAQAVPIEDLRGDCRGEGAGEGAPRLSDADRRRHEQRRREIKECGVVAGRDDRGERGACAFLWTIGRDVCRAHLRGI